MESKDAIKEAIYIEALNVIASFENGLAAEIN